MDLGFKPQFEEPIDKDIKIHTMRYDLTKRWYAGRKIHMVTGMRTKNRRCFNDKHTCTGVQEVFFTYFPSSGFEVSIDDKQLRWFEIEELAVNDGFRNQEELFDWFAPHIKKNGGSLNQRLIHWTDFRY
jgi:hypothetical protein